MMNVFVYEHALAKGSLDGLITGLELSWAELAVNSQLGRMQLQWIRLHEISWCIARSRSVLPDSDRRSFP